MSVFSQRDPQPNECSAMLNKRVPARTSKCALCTCSALFEKNTNAPRGYRITAIMRPCQGRKRGSTPLTRSKVKSSPKGELFTLYLRVRGVERVRSTGRACAGPGHKEMSGGHFDCPGPRVLARRLPFIATTAKSCIIRTLFA